MKTYKLVKLFTLTLFVATLLSLNCKAGGDVYEIYLNNKLVCKQQYGKFLCGENGLQLSKANINDNLVIRYNHCGRTGTGRMITLQDAQNHTIKEWKFADNASVTIPVKQILNLENKSTTTLKLYYFSTQYLPQGRMLTSVRIKAKEVAMNNPGKSWLTTTMLMFLLLRLV